MGKGLVVVGEQRSGVGEWKDRIMEVWESVGGRNNRFPYFFLGRRFFGSLSLGVTNDIFPTGRDLISHRISQGKEAMTKKVLDDDD